MDVWGLRSTRNLAGLCKTIFWRVRFILNEASRQEASRIKMDSLFKTTHGTHQLLPFCQSPLFLSRFLFQASAGALQYSLHLSGVPGGGCYPGPVATQEPVDMRTRRLLWEPQPPSHWIRYPNPRTRKGHPSFCSFSLWEIIPQSIIRKYREALVLYLHNKELSDSLMKKGMLYICLILHCIQGSLNLLQQY